jgi:cytochrome c oxidase subunit III
MSLKSVLFTPAEREVLEHTALAHDRLGEQYADLEQQRETALFGMWVFLASEVLFFGVLFLTVGIYRHLHPEEVEKASARLNWLIGGINTLVLLVSSLTMVLAVHYARQGKQKLLLRFLLLTALLGCVFLVLKGLEYYGDYRENLIPGWKFDRSEWVLREHLRPDQVPHVELFLVLYWIMTGLHGLHVTIGIAVVLVLALLGRRGHFTAEYYTPVEGTGLYWHFVDIVWIFLLPMLYLLGTR